MIGSGAYGLVCGFVDTNTNKKVAIKKNFNVFDDVNDGRRIYREMILLDLLNHDNIIKL